MLHLSNFNVSTSCHLPIPIRKLRGRKGIKNLAYAKTNAICDMRYATCDNTRALSQIAEFLVAYRKSHVARRITA
jgi:hypothetical protein